MDMNKIGSRIRHERKKHGFTIAHLSERSQISSNFLGNIERGVDIPSIETLINIANSLFVGVDALVADSLETESAEHTPPDFESMEILKEIKAMSKSQKKCVLSCIKALKEFNR
jgi:transcriptional regulator with XRE-family HTH domain